MSLTVNQYTLLYSGLLMIGYLVSRSVMKTVDKNDGSSCPHIAGPITACIFYGIAFIMLSIMTWKAFTQNLSKITLGFSVVLLLLTFGCFVAYIPFIVELQKGSSTECLKPANKEAIEYMELFIIGFLSIFLITSPFNVPVLSV